MKRLSKRLGIKPPTIWFRAEADAGYLHKEEALYLPSPKFALEGQPDLDGSQYWLLVAHEVAHYMSHKYFQRPFHSPQMYVTLLTIVLTWNLPLDTVWDEEHAYCPSAFRGGRKLAGKMLAGMLTGLRPVDSVLSDVTDPAVSEAACPS